MPLRLQMVPNSVFWPIVGNFAPSLVRMATANWEDTEVACILLSGALNEASAAPGRRWEENEFCIDPKTGLLRIHSEAPGIYSVYDYNAAVQFHGRTLPRQTTIVEGGATVLQIHLDSIEDANNDPNQFVPTKKMLSHGPRAIMVGPFRFPESVRAPAGYSGEIKPVIVHAILDQKGRVLDAELVRSSDPALTAAGLGRCGTRRTCPRGSGVVSCNGRPSSTCSSRRRRNPVVERVNLVGRDQPRLELTAAAKAIQPRPLQGGA